MTPKQIKMAIAYTLSGMLEVNLTEAALSDDELDILGDLLQMRKDVNSDADQ